MSLEHPPDLDATQVDRLQAVLPWYVNNTLDAQERQWVDALMVRSEAARRMLAQESIFRTRAGLLVEAAPGDLGLSRLLSTVRSPDVAVDPVAVVRTPQREAHEPPQDSWWHRIVDWVCGPRMAGAMLALVMIQASLLVWQHQDNAVPMETERGVSVTEVRTLRVRFRDDVSERDVRQALVAAGARMVAGPNQLGEYWLASELVSMEEMTASLRASGVTTQIEADTQGPREWRR